jgi:hypothetical protein
MHSIELAIAENLMNTNGYSQVPRFLSFSARETLVFVSADLELC